MSGRLKFKGAKACGAIHLSGQPADEEIVTIGDKVFEFDDDAAITAGRVSVTIGGSAALTAAALLAAINANKPTIPVTASADPVDASGSCIRLVADRVGANGNMVLTEAASNLTVSGATLLGGENAAIQTPARGAYTLTAIDILADNVMIETGLTSPRFAKVVCRTSAGLRKEITALVTVSGTKIQVAFAGATDPISTDVLTWEAWE